MKKLVKDIFGDVRAYYVAAFLAVLSPLIEEVRISEIEFCRWLISTETVAWSASGILFVLGISVLVLAYCYRLGVSEIGYTKRIKVGFRRWMIRCKPLAEQRALAAKSTSDEAAAFHERLMKHQRSQRGEID